MAVRAFVQHSLNLHLRRIRNVSIEAGAAIIPFQQEIEHRHRYNLSQSQTLQLFSIH